MKRCRERERGKKRCSEHSPCRGAERRGLLRTDDRLNVYEEEGRLRNVEKVIKVLSSELEGGKPRAPSGRSRDALLDGPISWKYNERTVVHLRNYQLALKSPFYIYTIHTTSSHPIQRVNNTFRVPISKGAKKGKKDNPWRDSNPQPSHVTTIHRSEKR